VRACYALRELSAMTAKTSQAARPSAVAVAVNLGIVYLVWGSTYFAIAVMVDTMPPLLSAGARYGSAGLGLLAWLAVRGELRRIRPSLVHWRSAVIIGGALLLGGNGGVVVGETLIPSGIAALLVATVPIWMALFDAAATRRRPSRLLLGGLLAGLGGVALLAGPGIGADAGAADALNPVGIGIVVIAALSWAAGSIYARHAPLPRSPFVSTAMEMVGGGSLLVLAGLLLGEAGRTDVAGFSIGSIVAWSYLVIFGSLVAFTSYVWLLARTSTSVVATYAYVNPVVALILGAVLLEEPINLRSLLAAGLILGAVVAMVSGRPRIAEQTGPDPELGTADAAVQPESGEAR
jgi:drug/metabolite transporter (DMT)-like permease